MYLWVKDTFDCLDKFFLVYFLFQPVQIFQMPPCLSPTHPTPYMLHCVYYGSSTQNRAFKNGGVWFWIKSTFKNDYTYGVHFCNYCNLLAITHSIEYKENSRDWGQCTLLVNYMINCIWSASMIRDVMVANICKQ